MQKKGPLNDRSLTLVRKEFDRLKGSNGYSEYVIGEYIDSGGYARVYAVNSLRGNGEKYALRISDVSSDENNGKNERETEAVKRLMARGQKHIVYFLMNFTVETTYGEERHTLYCTLMPFLCSLLKYENKADDIEIAVRLGNDLLPLLQTCMEKKIIHRDIKSGNILYDGDFRNEAGFVLGDFGEARTDVNGTVTDIGTWATVSPEIAGFDREIRRFHKLCDMYSLGLVMYYYLNGRVYPYGNEKKDFLERLDTKGALPPPKYGSPALKAVIVKATQYYPKDRFASPAEMLAALKKCEEYGTFILNEVSDVEETVILGNKEIQRLQSELAEKEQSYIFQIKMIRQHAAQKERQLQSQIALQQEKIEQLNSRAEALQSQTVRQQEKIEQLESRAAQREQELQTEIEKLQEQVSSGYTGNYDDYSDTDYDNDQDSYSDTDSGSDRGDDTDGFYHFSYVNKNSGRDSDDDYSDSEDSDSEDSGDSDGYDFFDDGDNSDSEDNGDSEEYDFFGDGGNSDSEDNGDSDGYDFFGDGDNRDNSDNSDSQDDDNSDDSDSDDSDSDYLWESSYTPGYHSSSGRKAQQSNPIIRFLTGDNVWYSVITVAVILLMVIIFAIVINSGDKVSAGDHITLGSYRNEPIEWRVLAVEDGKALVISEKLLDYVPYHTENEEVTWETSTLRQWLNNDFMDAAFSESEQTKICTNINRNPDNSDYGISGGEATTDRLFALNIDEAEKYFSSVDDRKAFTTDYAHKKNADDSDRSAGWWLRSPGGGSNYAASVRSDGDFALYGYSVDDGNVAIRPSFWLKL